MAPSQVNDSARQLQADVREWYNDAEWIIYGDGDGAHGIAYGSATGFSVVGANVAAVYHTGRRVKAVGALTGTIYGTIASSAFATNTAVTATWDAGALQNEALTVYLGILSRANSALPANAARTDIPGIFTAPQTFNGAVTLGAALNEAAELAIASAATVNIGAAASSNLLITGTTAITSLGTANAGIRRLLRFAGALTLTHNAAVADPAWRGEHSDGGERHGGVPVAGGGELDLRGVQEAGWKSHNYRRIWRKSGANSRNCFVGSFYRLVTNTSRRYHSSEHRRR